MKKGVVFILFTILILSGRELYSQDTCKVLKQEIAEKYSGKCKKGLAHGNGLAEGKDKYEGSFKNGLPHGKGKYTWANGDVYEGFWKLGKRDGEGKFWYKKNGADSMKYGVWRGDVFIKKIIPNPYVIIRTKDIVRYSVTKVRDGNRCLITFMQGGKINESIGSALFDVSSGTEYDLGSKIGYEGIVFPFTMKLTYTYLNYFMTATNEAIFVIQINEPGTWEITLNN